MHTEESTVHEPSSTRLTAEYTPVTNQAPEQTELRKLLHLLHIWFHNNCNAC
jgi:hypothetical protein